MYYKFYICSKYEFLGYSMLKGLGFPPLRLVLRRLIRLLFVFIIIFEYIIMNILSILSSLFIIFILYLAYNYTVDLENCKCADSVKENIYYIKNLELVLILLQVFGILSNVFSDYIKSNMFKILPFFMIYMIALLIILIVFIYNVYVFTTNTASCDCTNVWQKNILYIQSILYSISSIALLFIFGFLFKFSDKVKSLLLKAKKIKSVK